MTSDNARFGSAVALSLRPLMVAGEPGHRSASKIATGLAIILRVRLGAEERLVLASTAWLARDPGDLGALLTAVQRDRKPPWPFPGVDREMSNKVAREHIRRNPLPSPPPGCDHFAESPRAKLASAWTNATDRDLRDLVARVQVTWCRYYVVLCRFNSAEASRRARAKERERRHFMARSSELPEVLPGPDAARGDEDHGEPSGDNPGACVNRVEQSDRIIRNDRSGAGGGRGGQRRGRGIGVIPAGHEGDGRAAHEGADIRTMVSLCHINDLPRHVGQSVSSIKLAHGVPTKIEFHEKIRALQLLGRAYSMFDGRAPGVSEVHLWTGFQIIAPPDKQEAP